MSTTPYNVLPSPPSPPSPASTVPTAPPVSTASTTNTTNTGPTTSTVSTASTTNTGSTAPLALTVLNQSSLDNMVTRSLNEYTFELKKVTLDLVLKLIENDRQLLVHPVVETFLSVIWQKSKVRKLFSVLFCVHLFFLVGTAALIGTIGSPIWQPKGKFKNIY